MSDRGAAYHAAVAAAAQRGLASDWFSLGSGLHDNQRFLAAAACFARVLAQEPENHRAMANYGWNLHLGGRSEDGEALLARAAELAPKDGTPWALLSQVETTLGKHGMALHSARRAVELDPASAVNHVCLSFALMRLERWEEGWTEYEHRFAYKIPEFMSRPFRLWRGEQVGHLYLESEQGLGDTIMALRWLPYACALAERVTLYVQREAYALVPSMAVLPGNLTVFPMPRLIPAQADAWCPLMSLPAAFPAALRLGKAEKCGEYLRVTRGFREAGPLKVGICWAGSPTHDQTRYRDIPLAEFLRLAEIPGVELHSLQLGEQTAQLAECGAHGLLVDRAPEMTNLLDTANIVASLDLVVSVDTAVGHVAGAIGVPCWLLLNKRGQDYRWGIEGEKTGWYDAHRLFRRELNEDWSAVMARIGDELRRIVK